MEHTDKEMALKIFVDDDKGYLHWCDWAEGKSGYVLNTYRKPSSEYLILHRVTCRHIRQASSGTHWTHLYAKICSLDQNELKSWAEDHAGGAPHPCGTCKPAQDGDQKIPFSRIRIAELACEGGGECLYGRFEGGNWIYWTEGSSMTMDEHDTDYVRSWHGKETKDLLAALSRQWIMLSPIHINPEYREVFRLGYKQMFAALAEANRDYHLKWLQARWAKCLFDEVKT